MNALEFVSSQLQEVGMSAADARALAEAMRDELNRAFWIGFTEGVLTGGALIGAAWYAVSFLFGG